MTPRERIMGDIGLIALRHGITRHDILRKHNRCPRAATAKREAAKMLAAKGRNISEIARILNRNHATIYYYLDKVKKHGKSASESRFTLNTNDNSTARAGDHAGTSE